MIKKKTIRIKFEKYLKNKKVIISKRYHRTGLRYDIINKKCKVYSFDFINGREKNPFFYNFSKSKKMKKIDKVNFSLNFKNLIKLIINIKNQFFWRLYSLIKQEVTTIELLGVDGSGKTFFANNLSKTLVHYSKFEIYHLWKIQNTKKKSRPYTKKNYGLLTSYLKEIYLFINIAIFFFKNIFFDKKKKIIIFERSLRDILIDPDRYRLNNYPKFINLLINLIFTKAYILYFDISYNLSKKRKGEVNFKTYQKIKKNINKYFLLKLKKKNHLKIIIIKNKKWYFQKNLKIDWNK